ncbi:FG-GAP and VCBS repeat-containing protein [Streptomyces millisiae]|uniref:FG-GAP and VCBS repeat-containing protein n=1 Tax=Streptomyces millisiae TaxID=3075542 RepID=A0ABU2LQH4_9ACTN|nr:FG-GAP and VCBS repeat-containing protein [Streptomyces sp. DSM 44918]MDT0319825.1 FG-GAP and VCBS repeat-containing protein [Streptomyces sp. DSM 44918]
MRRSTLRIATTLGAAAVVGGGLLPAVPVGTAQAAPARYADDFNGDGYRDYAAWAWAEETDGADAVEITYGTASGIGTRRQVIHQGSPGVPGANEADDMFGATRTGADFNRDGYADLAVAAPGEDVSGRVDQGSVTILWGSANGLTGGTNVPSQSPAAYDRFGDDLATGDFNADGRPDLAVIDGNDAYVFRGDITPSGVAGSVTRLNRDPGFFATRLVAGHVTRDTATDLVVIGVNGYEGEEGTEAWFVRGGSTLAPGTSGRLSPTQDSWWADGVIADFDQDGYGDVAFGDDAYNENRGRATVWRGGANGPVSAVRITQSTAGVSGSPEVNDQFGWSVSAGDVNGDGYPDLAIGAPGEQIGDLTDAGAVHVLRGGPSGVTGTNSQAFDRGTSGVPGARQQYDRFGTTVRLRDTNRDGRADLLVDGGSGDQAAVRLPGTTSGISTSGASYWGDWDLADGALQ